MTPTEPAMKNSDYRLHDTQIFRKLHEGWGLSRFIIIGFDTNECCVNASSGATGDEYKRATDLLDYIHTLLANAFREDPETVKRLLRKERTRDWLCDGCNKDCRKNCPEDCEVR